mmetsp:Transcript_136059/g.379215  ORF Transcript_136059/g.379215 Transcript_136059/m.379215 type:complete len:218 (+) Transcript_136059:424-1077(+)
MALKAHVPSRTSETSAAQAAAPNVPMSDPMKAAKAIKGLWQNIPITTMTPDDGSPTNKICEIPLSIASSQSNASNTLKADACGFSSLVASLPMAAKGCRHARIAKVTTLNTSVNCGMGLIALPSQAVKRAEAAPAAIVARTVHVKSVPKNAEKALPCNAPLYPNNPSLIAVASCPVRHATAVADVQPKMASPARRGSPTTRPAMKRIPDKELAWTPT